MTELIRQPETDPAKFERVCAGKLAHETEAAALAALELERQGRIRHWKPGRRERMLPYCCEFCGKWHLGH
jgi:hypothetical protein